MHACMHTYIHTMIKYVPHTLSYTVLKVYFLKTLALPFIQYQRINDFQSSTLRVHTTCARAARVSWGGRWRCRPHPKIQDDQQTHAFSVVFPRIVAKARLYDAPPPQTNQPEHQSPRAWPHPHLPTRGPKYRKRMFCTLLRSGVVNLYGVRAFGLSFWACLPPSHTFLEVFVDPDPMSYNGEKCILYICVVCPPCAYSQGLSHPLPFIHSPKTVFPETARARGNETNVYVALRHPCSLCHTPCSKIAFQHQSHPLTYECNVT